MGDFLDDFAKQYGLNGISQLDMPDLQLAYKVGRLRKQKEQGYDMSIAGNKPETWGQGLGNGPAYDGESFLVGANEIASAIAVLVFSLETDPPETRKWS